MEKWQFQKSKCDKNQNLKMWQNSKTQNVTNSQKLKCDTTQKLKMWQNSKLQTVTKPKNPKQNKRKNSKCDQTQKLKMLQNSKTKMWKKKKKNVTKLIHQNREKKTQKLKLWPNSKNQILTKVRNSNWNQTLKKKCKLIWVVTTQHLDYRWNVFRQPFANFLCPSPVFFPLSNPKNQEKVDAPQCSNLNKHKQKMPVQLCLEGFKITK